jgi:hypothetical protein
MKRHCFDAPQLLTGQAGLYSQRADAHDSEHGRLPCHPVLPDSTVVVNHLAGMYSLLGILSLNTPKTNVTASEVLLLKGLRILCPTPLYTANRKVSFACNLARRTTG